MIIEVLPEHRHDEAADLWHEVGLTRPWNDPHDDLRRALAGPSSTVLAALVDGAVIGTVMVGHDGHRGWIYYLAVAPDRQRAGVGRRLVDAAERWLAASVPKVQLMVRRDNVDVTAFYERRGYVDDDVVVLSRWVDGR